MATLYISEYAGIGTVTNVSGIGMAVVQAQAPQEPPVTTQVVAIAGSTTASLAFNPATRFVRLHTDAICSVAFGASPSATTVSARLAANQTEYFSVMPGHAVAVITNV